jgi:hypothetical protein
MMVGSAHNAVEVANILRVECPLKAQHLGELAETTLE